MRHTKALHGFTLIELLVVIAIISLLVSILLPSLNRAKDLVRKTMCMSNLRNLGIQFLLFRDENEDRIPRCAVSNSHWWYATFKPSLGQYDESNNPSPNGSSPELLTCPEAPYELSGMDGFLTTYLYPRWACAMDAAADNPNLIAEPVSDISDAMRRPLLVDATLRTSAIDPSWGTWGTAFYHHGWDRNVHVSYRHVDAANTLFLDSHVESFQTQLPDDVWMLYYNAPSTP